MQHVLMPAVLMPAVLAQSLLTRPLLMMRLLLRWMHRLPQSSLMRMQQESCLNQLSMKWSDRLSILLGTKVPTARM